MAIIKIISLSGSGPRRLAKIDVTWDDGLTAKGVDVPDVPVSDFESAKGYLFSYVTGLYGAARQAADAAAFTPDPIVLAAVGHTFDDQGNILS